MNRLRFVGGIALIAASAVGCGTAATSVERIPAEPTLIMFADPAKVSGLTTRSRSQSVTGVRNVYIAYPEVENAPALTRKLERETTRQLDEFVAAVDSRSVKNQAADAQAPRPELNVDWQLTAASADITGVRLRTGVRLPTDFDGTTTWSDSLRTIWYDHTTGKAFDSPGLLDGDGALETLAAVVRTRLHDRDPDLNTEVVVADPALFDSMAFNPQGELVVEFDHHQVGPGSRGRIAVAVSDLQTGALLSPSGRRAQAAAMATETPRPQAPRATSTAREQGAVQEQNQRGAQTCTQIKCIALAFNDGPGPATDEILDLLAEAEARATFFTVGSNVAAAPEALLRMENEGHLVANHSWAHHDLSELSSSKATDSLRRTQEIIRSVTGQAPTLAAPPYGTWSETLGRTASGLGLAMVTGDIDAMGGGNVVERVIGQARPGAIVMLRDGDPDAIKTVPEILKRLSAEGYTFVTVPELYGPAGMTAGRLHTSGPLTP